MCKTTVRTQSQAGKPKLLRDAIAALSVVLLSATARAQTPSAGPTIRSQVREIVVPVVVTDNHGHHVPRLKASDFQVFEDGQPVRVVSFRTETDGSAAAAAPRSDRPPTIPQQSVNVTDPRRTYLVLVDTLHSSFANFGRIREALGKFLEKERGTDAQYAIIAIGRETTMVQDSTRDAAAALAAVRARNFATLIRQSESPNLALDANRFAGLMREYCSACLCISSGTNEDQSTCSSVKARVQMFLTSSTERMYLLNRQFLRQLDEIVKAIGTMPTSRTIVLLSDGFNRFPGRELYGILLGYGPKDHSFQFSSRDTQPELDAILRLATKNDVKFYTIDSRGLYTDLSTPGTGFDASSSSYTPSQMDARNSPTLIAGLPDAAISQAHSTARENTDLPAQLANTTGGIFFQNSNDLLKGIRQAVDDGREYYVMEYVPGNAAMDGTYRKILVTVPGRKWHVKAKAGYWAAE